MAVLAGNLVDPGVDAMAERDRLLDIATRRPRPLRKCDHAHPARQTSAGHRNQYAVHSVHFTSGLQSGSPSPGAAQNPSRDTQPEHYQRAAPHADQPTSAERFILKLSSLTTTRGLRNRKRQITNIARSVRQEKVMTDYRIFDLDASTKALVRRSGSDLPAAAARSSRRKRIGRTRAAGEVAHQSL